MLAEKTRRQTKQPKTPQQPLVIINQIPASIPKLNETDEKIKSSLIHQLGQPNIKF